MRTPPQRTASAGLLLVLLAALGFGPSLLASDVVEVIRGDGETIVNARLPGRLVDYAVIPGGDGKRQVLLLLAPRSGSEPAEEADGDPEEVPAEPEGSGIAITESRELPDCPATDTGESVSPSRSLYRFDPSGNGSLELLAEGLSADCTWIGGGDVFDQAGPLLVVCRDELIAVEPAGGELTSLAQGPSRFAGRAYRTTGGRPTLATIHGDALRLHGPADTGESWELAAEIPLPVAGKVRWDNLWVWSKIPQLIQRRPDGTLVFATAPQAYGTQRLMISLIEIDPAGEAQVTECWMRLPTPEDVIDAEYVVLEERPVLLVTTKPANKLSLFGEKLLRVYELERDRSRLGINPLFAVQSRMNIWQTARPLVLDVNADGHEDLVVAFWKGLMDDKVVLDVYLAEPAGGFRDRPRTTGFNVKNGERSFVEYGSDLTGNGFPDLLVGADGGLVLYPGLESSNGKKLVDKQRPYEVLRGGDSDDDDEVEVVISGDGMDTWQIHNSRVRPRLVDLDGDGRSELLLRDTGDADRPDLIRIVRIDAAP